MQLARHDFITCLHNGVSTLFVQSPHLKISDGRRLFDLGKAIDKLRMHLQTGDEKILCSAKGLHPIIRVLWYLLFTNRIMFDTILCLF